MKSYNISVKKVKIWKKKKVVKSQQLHFYRYSLKRKTFVKTFGSYATISRKNHEDVKSRENVDSFAEAEFFFYLHFTKKL